MSSAGHILTYLREILDEEDKDKRAKFIWRYTDIIYKEYQFIESKEIETIFRKLAGEFDHYLAMPELYGEDKIIYNILQTIEAIAVTELMIVLTYILKEEDGRKKLDLIWQYEQIYGNYSDDIKNEQLEEILGDLILDLSYYEPDAEQRREEPSYYGDDKLKEEITTALEKVELLAK